MDGKSIRYRPDIDGLRAIAIICVVLYHVGVPGFEGGFVGVDLFFAISGYLIFSILHREYEVRGRVNWLEFYARRIQRLIPEATIMIVTVMALGSLVLFPVGEQSSLAKSGIAGSLWIANLHFWRFAGDYFAPAIERQPLLHLWSLGLEEQFYLTVPIAFLFTSALSRWTGLPWRQAALILLCAFGALSLCIAGWSVSGPWVAAYYLLPTRAYEFVIGALAVLCPKLSQRATLNSRAALAATVVGFLGIVVSLAAVHGHRFPGAWALLPTISVSLLLWSGNSQVKNPWQRLLETAPVVYLGRISYGWYLWHFPLLVLWREYWLLDVSVWSGLAVSCVALAPAAAGYHFVLRLKKALNSATTASDRTQNALLVAEEARADVQAGIHTSIRTGRWFAYGGVATAAAVFVSAAFGGYAKYFASRRPEMSSYLSNLHNMYKPGLRCYEVDEASRDVRPECMFGDPKGGITIVIWGDSHANHWVPALDLLFKERGIRGIEWVRGGCTPLLGESELPSSREVAECLKFGERVIQDVEGRRRSGPVSVILSARWGMYMGNELLSIPSRTQLDPNYVIGAPAMESSLRRVIATLASLRIPVGIVLQAPEQKFSVPDCVRRWALARCEVPWLEEEAYLSPPKAALSAIAQLGGALVIDPAPFMCRSGRCAVKSGNTLLYHDDHHVSIAGAHALAPFLSDFVNSLRDQAYTQ